MREHCKWCKKEFQAGENYIVIGTYGTPERRRIHTRCLVDWLNYIGDWNRDQLEGEE